jgi:YVTN family beta-propeller protein
MKRSYSVSLAITLAVAIVLVLSSVALAGPLSVLNTINVASGSPWGSTVNTTTNKAYLSGYGGKVWVVGGITDALGTTITVGGNGTATGIAANPNTNKIYVGQFITPSVAVIDGNTDTVSTTIPISSGQPTGVAVNPVTNRVYVANQDVRTVTVIDGATDTVLTTITGVGTCPWGIGVNTTTNEIYVTDNGGIGTPQVNVIDGNTNTVTHSINLGERVGFVAVNSVTNKVYATLFTSGQVAVIDGATYTWTTTITGFSAAYGIAVDSSRNQVLVSSYGNSTAKLVNGATNTIMDSIGVGAGPYGMACNPSTGKAYVPNSSTQNLSVLHYVAPPVTVSSSSNPAGGGTTSGDGTYNYGDTVNMVASANPGYHFVNWTEGGTVVSTNDHYSFTASANRVLVANFGYQVTVISEDSGGTVSGGGTFVAGSSVTVSGHPLYGTHLQVWWDPAQGSVSFDQDYTFNVTTDRTLYAAFGYTISLAANPPSGGHPMGVDPEYGMPASVDANTNAGYAFLN